MKYIADDGKIFENEQDCRNYEILYMSKDKIRGYDGSYDGSTINIGEPVALLENTLSEFFNEADIVCIPEGLYVSILENEQLPTQGLVKGWNIWNDADMEWNSLECVRNKIEAQLNEINNLLNSER